MHSSMAGAQLCQSALEHVIRLCRWQGSYLGRSDYPPWCSMTHAQGSWKHTPRMVSLMGLLLLLVCIGALRSAAFAVLLGFPCNSHMPLLFCVLSVPLGVLRATASLGRCRGETCSQLLWC